MVIIVATRFISGSAVSDMLTNVYAFGIICGNLHSVFAAMAKTTVCFMNPVFFAAEQKMKQINTEKSRHMPTQKNKCPQQLNNVF